jgi:membrane protein insertase Oxa1/YidC/SpoIIIJ
MILGTHLFGHLNVSQAGLELAIWWLWEPSCFLSVTWHGEAFYGLGVQGIKVLILLRALFLPIMAPASQQGF